MTTALDLTGATNYCARNGAYSGSQSGADISAHGYGLSDSGENGILVASSNNVMLSEYFLSGFNGSAFKFTSSHFATDAHAFSKIFADRSYIGINCAGSSYATFSDCFANGNAYGIRDVGSNTTFVGCRIVGNGIGINLLAVDNDAHGQFIGCSANHNYVNLQCDGITLGETFEGCHFLGGDIVLNGSKGILISGGQIGTGNVAVDATSELILRGVLCRGGTVAFTVAAGGKLDAQDCVIEPGTTVTLNGSAWSVNTEELTSPGDVECGSYTATLIGASAAPTFTVNWRKSAGFVDVNFPGFTCIGTGAALGLTGMPSGIRPGSLKNVYPMTMNDGGPWIYSQGLVMASGEIRFFSGMPGSVFTGSCAISESTLTYKL